jgi:hypothetical protein
MIILCTSDPSTPSLRAKYPSVEKKRNKEDKKHAKYKTLIQTLRKRS